LLQLSVVHALVSSQLVQAAPTLPHWVAVVEVMHVDPFQQPVQQLPFLQVPAPELHESVLYVLTHAPAALQLSLVQGSSSLQFWQLAPAFPHWVVVGDVTHVLPVQQPVQQLPFLHVPAPELQGMSLRLVMMQVPVLQLAVLHGSTVWQTKQSCPPFPHWADAVPVWQVLVDDQQPIQQTPFQQVPSPGLGLILVQEKPFAAGSAAHAVPSHGALHSVQ
jgi:hypothetical protein